MKCRATLSNAIFSFLGIFAAVPISYAAMPVSEITENVITVATKYADAVSCGNTEINSNRIAALVPWTEDNMREDAIYAVLWSADIGCAGGSGSSSTYISIVKVGGGNSFYVVPELSSPVIEFKTGTRFVNGILGNTSDLIIVEGLFHDDDDSNSFPSIKRKIAIKLDENGNWSP